MDGEGSQGVGYIIFLRSSDTGLHRTATNPAELQRRPSPAAGPRTAPQGRPQSRLLFPVLSSGFTLFSGFFPPFFFLPSFHTRLTREPGQLCRSTSRKRQSAEVGFAAVIPTQPRWGVPGSPAGWFLQPTILGAAGLLGCSFATSPQVVTKCNTPHTMQGFHLSVILTL